MSPDGRSLRVVEQVDLVVVDGGVGNNGVKGGGVREWTLRARLRDWSDPKSRGVVFSGGGGRSEAVVVSADREGSIHSRLLYLPVRNSVGPADSSYGIRPEGGSG